MQIQAAAICVCAVLSTLVSSLLPTFVPMPLGFLGVFAFLCLAWARFSVRLVDAHGRQVLVRNWYSDTVALRKGSFFLFYPEYVVKDRMQFGPWMDRISLPAVGQTIEIDVPDVLAPVEHGVYCLQINTKVIGKVEQYSVDDLLQNQVSVETVCHDAIAHALRSAVFDKPVEEALAEVQRIFLKDSQSISALISVPTFKVTKLSLDADQRVRPADTATQQAFDLAAKLRQESAKKAAAEAAMATEEQKVKLAEVTLKTSRNEMMLQQEVFGKEGAALIEASKQAKALYLFSGTSGMNSTVLSLP